MQRTIEVRLGEAADRVGTLRHERRGARESAAFEYARSWLDDVERYALDPALPCVAGPQFRRSADGRSIFPSVLADTEPDGWGRRVIQRDHAKRRAGARRRGESVDTHRLDALDYLLAVDDASRIGALRLVDEHGVFQRTVGDAERRTPPPVELGQLLSASRAVETDSETGADLAYLLGRATSLGGLRPKCSVLDEDASLAIGKFPSVGDTRSVVHGEVLALRLARDAGIDAAAARLVDADGTAVALVRRFDRTPDGERLMYASAATMLGADPGGGDEHCYTEIVDALRRHGSSPTRDTEELWRRMAFSILITNVDDHLRNHGFLHVRRGQWRLSPAFDVNPFPERQRELKTWVSEETGPEATVDALMSVIAYFRIKPERARRILGEVDEAVGGWRRTARILGMTKADLEAFEPAFEHEEREAARRVIAEA